MPWRRAKPGLRAAGAEGPGRSRPAARRCRGGHAQQRRRATRPGRAPQVGRCGRVPLSSQSRRTCPHRTAVRGGRPRSDLLLHPQPRPRRTLRARGCNKGKWLRGGEGCGPAHGALYYRSERWVSLPGSSGAPRVLPTARRPARRTGAGGYMRFPSPSTPAPADTCSLPGSCMCPHPALARSSPAAGLRWRGTGRSALPLRWSGRARPLLSAPKTAPAGTESFAVGRIEPWRRLGAFCPVRGRISCAGTVLG